MDELNRVTPVYIFEKRVFQTKLGKFQSKIQRHMQWSNIENWIIMQEAHLDGAEGTFIWTLKPGRAERKQEGMGCSSRG